MQTSKLSRMLLLLFLCLMLANSQPPSMTFTNPPYQINSSGSGETGDQNNISACRLSDGKIAVVYQSGDDIGLQIVTSLATGATARGEFVQFQPYRPASNVKMSCLGQTTDMNPKGAIVVTWQSP